MINRVKHFLPKKALITLYHSLFHCHISYCPTLLNCIPSTLLGKMVRLQKKVIRTITSSHPRAHTQPLFTDLGILPLEDVVKKATIVFMHSIFHDYAPPSYLGHWTRFDERVTGYNLREGDDFVVPFARTESVKKLPLYIFAKIWNMASPNKYIRNRYTFCQAISQEFQPALFPPLPSLPPPILP